MEGGLEDGRLLSWEGGEGAAHQRDQPALQWWSRSPCLSPGWRRTGTQTCCDSWRLLAGRRWRTQPQHSGSCPQQLCWLSAEGGCHWCTAWSWRMAGTRTRNLLRSHWSGWRAGTGNWTRWWWRCWRLVPWEPCRLGSQPLLG